MAATKCINSYNAGYYGFALIRFHAYAVTTQMDLYERGAVNANNSRSTLVSRKKVFGGTPDGAGMREDVMLIFEELEEARNNVTQIKSIIKEQNERLATGRNALSCLLTYYLRGGLAVGRWTCDLQVAGSIPAGPLSRSIGQLSLASLRVAKSSTCFGWG